MVGRITLFQLRHSKSPNSEDSDLCHYCPVGQNSPPGPLQRAAAGWAQTPDCMRGGEDTEGGGAAGYWPPPSQSIQPPAQNPLFAHPQALTSDTEAAIDIHGLYQQYLLSTLHVALNLQLFCVSALAT